MNYFQRVGRWFESDANFWSGIQFEVTHHCKPREERRQKQAAAEEEHKCPVVFPFPGVVLAPSRDM